MAKVKRTPLGWLRLLAAVVAVSYVFVEGVAGRLAICDDSALQSGKIVKVCRGPVVSDLVVVAGGVLLLLLLAAEFQEIGLFGFSLKNRVEQQEQRAARLESSLALLDLKIDSRANATATNNVILVTAKEVRDLREGAPAKAAEFLDTLRGILEEQ